MTTFINRKSSLTIALGNYMIFSVSSQETVGNQESLLIIVKEDDLEIVKDKVTARALMNDGENPLLLSIKVSSFICKI